MGLHMASIYCTDCTRQAGDDNWTECYYCGGKNLKKTRRARAEAQAKKPRKKTLYRRMFNWATWRSYDVKKAKKEWSEDKWGDTKFAIVALILLVFVWGGVIDGWGEPTNLNFLAYKHTGSIAVGLIVTSIVSILFVLVLYGQLLSLINYLWDKRPTLDAHSGRYGNDYEYKNHTWQRRRPHNRSLKPLFTAVVLVVAVIVFLYVVVNIYPFVDYLIDKIKTVTHT